MGVHLCVSVKELALASHNIQPNETDSETYCQPKLRDKICRRSKFSWGGGISQPPPPLSSVNPWVVVTRLYHTPTPKPKVVLQDCNVTRLTWGVMKL